MDTDLQYIRETCPAAFHDFAVLLFMAEASYQGTWSYAGSIRRREMSVESDIDMVIEKGSALANLFEQALDAGTWEHRKPSEAVYNEAVRAHPYVQTTFLKGRNGAKADVAIVDRGRWASALLWFTGPRRFNRALEKRAESIGLAYSGGVLTPTERRDQPFEFSTELEVLHALGFTWVSPKNRSTWRAEAGTNAGS
jgi:DNA polymerase/3'-5' exonuclease PolX